MAASRPENGKSMEAEEAEVTSELQGPPGCGRSAALRPPEIDVAFPPAQQPSIYSRTLDEIQNSVCEPGKNFGSMNMDEFLTNLWNVEEGFVSAGAVAAQSQPAAGPPTLNRQGSLSLPSPLSRKTVDEVWAEIHCEQQPGRQRQPQQPNHHRPNGAANRESSFGEMTLEDFLIKAGVVREGYAPVVAPPPPTAVPSPQYGLAPAFGHVYGGGTVPNGRRGDLYCYTGDVDGSVGGGGGGGGLHLGMTGSPVSPMSSDGMGGGGDGVQLDGYGVAMDGIGGNNGVGGRKRLPGGAVEVVVERRQRRMIKNRESAARSRARKQAYTVELEAELNQLKEENVRLREEERRGRQIRKQMLLEAMAKQARSKMEINSRALRRSNSSPS